jgi:hypothetical protein
MNHIHDIHRCLENFVDVLLIWLAMKIWIKFLPIHFLFLAICSFVCIVIRKVPICFNQRRQLVNLYLIMLHNWIRQVSFEVWSFLLSRFIVRYCNDIFPKISIMCVMIHVCQKVMNDLFKSMIAFKKIINQQSHWMNIVIF